MSIFGGTEKLWRLGYLVGAGEKFGMAKEAVMEYEKGLEVGT